MKMNIPSTLFKTARQAFKESLYGSILLAIILSLLHTGLYTAILMVEKNLIDKLYNISEYSIKFLILYIILFFVLKNLLNVIWTTRFIIRLKYEPKLDLVLRTRMAEKISSLNLVYFEDSKLFDLIEKAKNAAFYAVTSFCSAYLTLFGHLATVIGVTIYLSYLKPIFILIILFSTVPKILNFKYRGRKRIELEDEQAPIRRKCDYYSSCITDREYFKETRLFGSFRYFKTLWRNSIKILNAREWNNLLKLYPIELLINATNFLSYMSTFSLAFFYLYKGDISIGAFAAVLSSLDILDYKIEKVLSNVKRVFEEGAIAGNYYSFMELDEKNCGEKDVNLHPIESIEFKNVSFSYPSIDHNAIKDLSINIKKGETIAIVGLNGAGKTTFIKLLLGLLNPTSGEIMYNHIDISEINDDSLHIGTSALFQTFGKYMLSIGENVAISDSERMDDISNIEESLDFVDFKLNRERFPDGLDSQLGKEFGGTDLSGGQWQLLALARAYFRKSDLIILDEPTSAIDPILEDEIFRNFQTMSKSKTAIIVTHRLGATKVADRILVFDKGRIIEDGNHEKLIDSNGLYAQLYNGQSDWYDR